MGSLIMKKHTRVLSFIAFCIVLGALPIVGGCQATIGDGLNWWSEDADKLYKQINDTIQNNFIIAPELSLIHI